MDHVACPAHFAPAGGLSGDRETATAQAAAEFLRRQDVTQVMADRSLPLIYTHALREAGIDVQCDLDLGVTVRRAKDAEEIEHLREASMSQNRRWRWLCAGRPSQDCPRRIAPA